MPHTGSFTAADVPLPDFPGQHDAAFGSEGSASPFAAQPQAPD